MSTWLNEAESLALGLAGMGVTVATAFSLGKLAGEYQTTAEINKMNTKLLKLLNEGNMENCEKTRLIELMKRAGRRKREENRELKNRVRFLEEKEIRRKNRRSNDEHMA